MSNNNCLSRFILLVYIATLFSSCHDDVYQVNPDVIVVDSASCSDKKIIGLYLLNEGNMGSNKSTLDYYDYVKGEYVRNIYSSVNPTIVQELGDVGNDLQIYGSRMYAVINCSNYIEVMDSRTARHIGTINIPNCRYVRFSGKYGYVTSYAGSVVDVGRQLGYVAKFDTASLQIIETCTVGYQPDELEIVGNRIYVANSGGYMVPNYENTISVIDKDTFKEIKRIEVVSNLHHVRVDNRGQLWVSSRGDYYGQHPKLYCIDINTESVVDSLDVVVGDFDLVGDSLYILGTEFSYKTYNTSNNYCIVDVITHKVDNCLIKDGSDSKIKVPYGIKVNEDNGDIFVTDAKDYVNPGKLYCYGKDGIMKWSVSTGDIPSHMVFLKVEL